MIDIDECRSALPLPRLLEKLGMQDRAKASALCPFHDDKVPSFGIFYKDRWHWKCHAGCGSGDEVDFLQKLNSSSKGDAIRRYADLAGVQPESSNGVIGDAEKIFGGVAVKDKAYFPKITEQFEIKPLPPRAIQQLAESREISHMLLRGLSDAGQIAVFTNAEKQRCVAFKVTGGYHYRKPDGTWRYTPGAKPDLFVPGEIEEGAPVHCFESQWDALVYADASGEVNNIVATRGASNVNLLAERLRGHTGTLYLWPQNDEPGHNWAENIREALPGQQIKIVQIPPMFVGKDFINDLNDWRKNGATDGAIWQAFIDAREMNLCKPPTNNITNDTRNTTELKTQKTSEQTGREKRQTSIDLSQDKAAPTVQSGIPPALISTIRKQEICDTASQPETWDKSNSPSRSSQADLSASAPTVTENITLAAILDRIVGFLNRYITFTSEEQANVIALWISHTWVFQAFRFTPYLNVCSPEKRCGKTRLLECLERLVERHRRVSGISASALRRVIDKEHPALMIDEIDTVFTDAKPSESTETLRAALNGGFQVGAKYICCEGPFHEIREFDIFSPKVIAGIGKKVPDTVTDRSIEIRLVRQMGNQKAEVFRDLAAREESKPLRAALRSWSKTATEKLAAARPQIPKQLTDRQQDMSEGLLAIADMAGPDWANRARVAIVSIFAHHEDQSITIQLLADCREIFAAKSADKITTTGLLEALIGIESADSPWPAWWEHDVKRGDTRGPAMKLAKLLGPFGIKSANIKTTNEAGHEVVTKGYARADFSDAWKRYLEPVRGMVTKELQFDLTSTL